VGEPLPLRSFKLRFADEHVRIVPALDAGGCAFSGPGCDVRGARAREAFVRAQPLLAWLYAREPVRVRSLSCDLDARRVLVTVDDAPRPRVLRIGGKGDPGGATELLDLAAPLVRYLGELARDLVDARGAPSS